MYKHNIEARSRNHCCHGKAVNITYSECVSAYISQKTVIFIFYILFTVHHVMILGK